MSRKNTEFNLIQNLALNLIPLTSILITPFYSFESVNLPKFVCISTIGFISLIYLILNFKFASSKLSTTLKIIIFGFIVNFIIVYLSSDTPWQQQLYGRENRRLGLIFFVSVLLIMVVFSQIDYQNKKKAFVGKLGLSGILVLSYAVIQLLGIDPFKWDTGNIHYFSSLGNPNFLSAFLAITFIPIAYLINSLFKFKNIYLNIFINLAFLLLVIYFIYRTNSTQGFIVLFSVGVIWVTLWLYKLSKKMLLSTFVTLSSLLAIIVISGIFNKGILAPYIFDNAILSRSDFFRAAIKIGGANIFTGVGFDAFGDYYLAFRDSLAGSRPFAEYADSSHNYFLDFFANFGLLGLLLYMTLTTLVFLKFIKIIKNNNFDQESMVIFCVWVALQIQSLVSPSYNLFLLMIFSISGFILSKTNEFAQSNIKRELSYKIPITIGLSIALIVNFPAIKRENLILKANNQSSPKLLMEALESFPKSTVGYTRAISIFETNGLQKEALQTSRRALLFNDRTPASLIVIFLSPFTSESDKTEALNNLLKLDPNNPAISALRS